MGVVLRMFNKPAQISLVREGQIFFLASYYDRKPMPIASVAEKWPELLGIVQYAADPNSSRNVVPICKSAAIRADLQTLQRTCEANKKINIYIHSEVERVEIRDTHPDEFEIIYQRQDDRLLRILPADVIELDDGWLRSGNMYWRYTNIPTEAQKRYRQPIIHVEEWVDFLSKDLRAYRKAGVPIRSDLEYDAAQAVSLEIHDIHEDRAQIRTIWHVSPDAIEENPQLHEHVIANHVIHPGLRPGVVREALPADEALLEGCSLAHFLHHHYPALKKWFASDPTVFENVHRFVEPPYHWELSVRSELDGIIGKPVAHPIACIGNDRFSVDELRDMLQMPYARISTGWVRKTDLLTLGMDESGTSTTKQPMLPFSLNAQQLLHRGGQELGSTWSAMTCEGAPWVNTGDKHTCARKHLEYLFHWGINGGLLGGYEAMIAYGLPLLASLSTNDKLSKILIMGRREDIRMLKESYALFLNALTSNQEFHCMDYDTVFHNQDIRYKCWDLLVMIEPDVTLHPAEKERLLSLKNMQARCKIGFFQKELSAETILWDAQMIDMKGYPNLIELLIRDCRNSKELPAAYVFKPVPMPAATPIQESAVPTRNVVFRTMDDGSAETTLPGHCGQGIPIPPKPTASQSNLIDLIEDDFIDLTVDDFVSHRHEAFFAEARKLAAYEAPPSDHIPFFCYWPKYAEMDKSQRKWYFYLRSCIRRGEYPDTDLSYIYVYVYELLALIGVRDAAEGLKMLTALAQAYGKQYPQLQNHLNTWIYDFLHVYDCGVSTEEVLHNMQDLSEAGLNELLTAMADKDNFDIPLWALERLSAYKVTSSKFYQRGNQQMIEQCILGALKEIDQQLHKKKGKGLLSTYAQLKMHTDTISAFSSAVCEKQLTYTLRCRHYQNGSKLANFLKNALRYTENALRKQFKYGARLQGVVLDEQSKTWIDAYLTKQTAAQKMQHTSSSTPQKPTGTQIILDPSKLAQLRAESDDVRQALLSTIEDASADDTQTEHPPETADGQLTDLDAVQGILTQVTADQNALLVHLAAHDWQAPLSQLKETFPHSFVELLIDGINEAAFSRIGCFLVELEGDVFVIAEDYRDELEHLLPKQEKTSGFTVTIQDADDEWKEFFSMVDIQLLVLLLEGMDAFKQHMKKQGEMPEPRLEEINNAAMDTIGDLLVTEDGIAEEYLPIVQQCLKKG